MARKPSKATKISKGYGRGSGKDYSAWEHANEHPNGAGTRVQAVDWKTGRTVDLLSQGEYRVWLWLRFNDDVIDINEQYPLDKEKTDYIASLLGFGYSKNPDYIMSTDFLVTYSDGHKEAISVKPNRKALENKKKFNKICIEKAYWENQGIKFRMAYSDNIDRRVTDNIRLVTRYYDPNTVTDHITAIKHLIATKQFVIELNQIIDYKALAESIITDEVMGIIEKEKQMSMRKKLIDDIFSE
ncbi:MAG: TnsA endonuclease N-terminal domain-containing protein [Anaerobutyricum hallii]|uniref:TnsA endonuclease N-terminal domain-containing protein n=1 Tax=Anaerobutyricum hallii TaxID=39488 RepID=UPI002431825F|nr:TnsA endonuclease N-terminal domain-containing protein [Anaerobutyricum hallii]MDD6588326.1 TnsA endonuclease N-terminal domain-containing protein [Anaerobutyricum hallii]